MLEITLTSTSWDSEKEEFLYDVFVLHLEHSLVSLSKWESKFKKAFLGPKEKTTEEVYGYIEAMHVGEEIPVGKLNLLTDSDVEKINAYIEDSMTATTINERKTKSPPREIITSELIYYWITSYQIPWEAQHWHLNRLLTLIKVFNAKNSKPEPRSRAEVMAERRALNAERLRKYNTTG